MIIASVRSGLVEAVHPVTIAAAGAGGEVVLTIGDDVDRPFFMRSAAKPFQGFVSQLSGADLGAEELAVACGSHGAQPLHLAYVRRILAGARLEETSLLCPPARPLSESASDRAVTSSLPPPAAIYHNCSGKHAAMLRACVASGWSLEYKDPAHPLQRRILEHAEEITGRKAEPVGVDGCGVPTLRTNVVGLAKAFSRLASDPDLVEVADAMRRFGALTSDGDREEAALTRWVPAAVKGGARGCMGIALPEVGLALAAKAWTGDHGAAVVGVVEALMRLGVLPSHPRRNLEGIARPPVLGGGRGVGSLQPLEDLV